MELSTRKAKHILKHGARKILIDNTVLAHGVTHETGWIATGDQQWGDTITVPTGYNARIPVHDDLDNSSAARSVRFLPGIANLGKHGILKLMSSDELRDETWTQPTGRFRGYGYLDYSLFRNVKMETIRDPDYTVVFGGPSSFPTDDLRAQRASRMNSKTDPLFKDLVKALGQRNSQDAWHITTAERHQCYCFLTMDFKLIRTLSAQRNNPVVKSLTTKVLTPEDLGVEISLTPIPPRFYSYHDASFPVEHGINWPDSKRQKKNG